ncbi:MAG: gamma-glutamyl-phosphate reductase, partial [Raoultibacter sp.]
MMHDASAEKTESVRSIALAAKEASVPLATTTSDARNEALRSMACALRAHAAEIVAENSLDMQAAKNAGTS